MRHLPLSALQQRFWYLCTAYPGEASPILVLNWRLRGPLDLAAWRGAVNAVVDRHESLRTGFVLRDGEPVQVVMPPAGIDTPVVDLTGHPPEERDARAGELLSARTHRLLDLTADPLVGSTLLRLADDHHVWCFTMHHLLADGASLRTVGREVRAGYLAALDGAAPDLPPLTLQYGDFAQWQSEQDQAAELAYWQGHLSGAPSLELPTDLPRPAEKSAHSAEHIHLMPPELAEQVAELSRRTRCTPFMVLLTALQLLLGERSGQDDFCVGTPVAGRVRAEFEPVVGLFANTLALRADLAGDPTFAELLKRTRATVIGGLQRQSVPLGRIIATLGVPRDPGRTQLFDVVFSMRNDGTALAPRLGPLEVEGFPHGHAKVLHDLVFDIWRLDSSGLRAGIRYDTALFKPDTVDELARRYEQILSAAVARPGDRLSELGATRG
ncbi:condensation domain-containing protein [Catellatospora sp. KI3]|uniref:condensation domain-containing protein n=1 Tax=Catellatospora sp. KI3 TaxID=3041620 RepID=UPI0024828694|nr:condensation domain-containing protein [Catellatospora sp. KI3]MDI1460949.1 condensation domain-containing protein [Catellatospora sp. KI3]